MSTRDNAITGQHPDSTIMVLVIALVAVAAAALVVSSPVFLAVALCVGLAVVAVLRFDWFVAAQIFLLPWYPLLDLKPPLRDISLVLRFVLLAGVWMIRRQRGKSAVQWFLGSRIKKAIMLFAAVAAASLLLSVLGPNTNALRSLARL